VPQASRRWRTTFRWQILVRIEDSSHLASISGTMAFSRSILVPQNSPGGRGLFYYSSFLPCLSVNIPPLSIVAGHGVCSRVEAGLAGELGLTSSPTMSLPVFLSYWEEGVSRGGPAEASVMGFKNHTASGHAAERTSASRPKWRPQLLYSPPLTLLVY